MTKKTTADTWCPYPGCGFNGTDAEVDEHRTYVRHEGPQAGSNLSHRPRPAQDGAVA